MRAAASRRDYPLRRAARPNGLAAGAAPARNAGRAGDLHLMPKIISMDAFAARRQPTDHYTRDWGGWTTLSRDPAANVANVRKTFDGKQVHEEDFLFFRHLDGRPGLFVDIGANMGFSAISFRNVNKSMRILSFEILPLLRDVLRLVQRDVPAMEVQMVGLSDHAEQTRMYVPVFRSLLCTPLASLDAGQFDLPHRKEDWLQTTGLPEFELLEVPVELRTLDSFGLAPTVVKIDVEGVELSTMKGGAAT